jgi:actin-related protein
MPHSIMRVDVAGRDVTRYLRLLLRKEGVNFRTSAEFEIVRTIKVGAEYCNKKNATSTANNCLLYVMGYRVMYLLEVLPPRKNM